MQHDQTGFDGLQFGGRGNTRELSCFADLVPNVVGGLDVIPPLAEILAIAIFDQFTLFIPYIFPLVTHLEAESIAILIRFVFGFVQNHVFVHGQRSGIQGTFDSTRLSYHGFYLGNGRYCHVQHPQIAGVFLCPRVRHGTGHEQEGTFI